MRADGPSFFVTLILLLLIFAMGFLTLRDIYFWVGESPTPEDGPASTAASLYQAPEVKQDRSPDSSTSVSLVTERGEPLSGSLEQGPVSPRLDPVESLSVVNYNDINPPRLTSNRPENNSGITGKSLRPDEGKLPTGSLRGEADAKPVGNLRDPQDSVVSGSLRPDEGSLPTGSLR